jgi:hypothetical protein
MDEQGELLQGHSLAASSLEPGQQLEWAAVTVLKRQTGQVDPHGQLRSLAVGISKVGGRVIASISHQKVARSELKAAQALSALTLGELELGE